MSTVTQSPADYDFLQVEPAEQYHAQRGRYLSSHLLADFRRCPQLYWLKVNDILPEEDRPAFALGRAAHSLILEGRAAFNSEFTIGGPINPRTGQPYGQETKAWKDREACLGKTILTDAQYAQVDRMDVSVRAHAAAAELLASGVAERVVRATYGVACQIRLDWFDLETGIVDLKTCDDLTYFEADARRFGYLFQCAFYRAVLAAKTGLCVPVHLIAVEKKEPYRTGVWKLDPEALRFAESQNAAAIERLKRCQANDSWPTGFEDVRIFDAF